MGCPILSAAFLLKIVASNGFCGMTMCVSIAQTRVNCASWVCSLFWDEFWHRNGYCDMSMRVSIAQARARKLCVPIVAQHFPINSLWEGSCAQAQTVRPDLSLLLGKHKLRVRILPQHFSCKFSREMAFLHASTMSMCMCIATALAQNVHPNGGPAFSSEFWHAVTLSRCPSAFRLRKIAQMVHPSLGLRMSAACFLYILLSRVWV